MPQEARRSREWGYPASSAVADPADASRFVAERVAEGADYIKVIVEDSRRMGVAALVEAAHQAGLKAIAHVTSITTLNMAADAGVDILTHAPFDADVDDNLAIAIAT